MNGLHSRRAIIRSGMMGAAGLALSACAPKQAPAQTEPAQPVSAESAPTVAQPEAPVKEAEVITLRFLTRQGDMGVYMREFAQRFSDESGGRVQIQNEEVPAAEVTTVLQTQVVTDTMVDLTWGDHGWWPYLAKIGAFLVIEDYVSAAGMDVSNWFGIEWFRKWTDGQLSGLPGEVGCNALWTFYDKEWVTEAWGKDAWDDWTIDDYVECMQACVKHKGEGFFGGNPRIGSGLGDDGWYRKWGAGLIDDTGTTATFDDPRCQEAVQWQIENLKNGNFPDREEFSEGTNPMFFSRKLATVCGNAGVSQGMVQGAEENGFELGVVLIPCGPTCQGTPKRNIFSPLTNTFGVWRKTKYPQEAFDLMVRVTSVEAMKWLTLTTGKQPGAVDNLAVWYDPEVNEKFPWFAKAADALKTCVDPYPMPANTRYTEVSDLAKNEIPGLIYGTKPLDAANIQMVNDHIQEILDLPMPGR